MTGAQLLALIPETLRDKPHPNLRHDGRLGTPREAAEEYDEAESARPMQPTCPACVMTLKVLAGVIPGAA